MKISTKILIVTMSLMVLWLPLLAACGGDDKTVAPTAAPTSPTPETEVPTASPTSPTPESTAIPETPTYTAEPEGTLTVGVQAVTVDGLLGPFAQGADSTRNLWSAMADFLILERSDESGYVPSLAEKWEMSPDETSVTFTLRQGVQFHDGWGELTAEDVKFTIETTINKDLGGRWARAAFLGDLIDRIETSDPYELTVHCNGPWASGVLAYLVPSNEMGIAIVSKAYYDETGIEEGNKHPIFSGPYKLVDLTMGEKMVLEAVSNHWRVVPEFKTLIFKEVPELATRVAMLQAGEADVIQVDPDRAAYLRDEGFDLKLFDRTDKLVLTLGGQWYPERETYDPNFPWLDKRVRQAMNLAIDREEILQHLYYGMGEPLVDVVHLPFDESREPYPYDLDRAKELMAEAGYADGFDAKMWIFAFPGMADPTETMLAVAGYWEEIGIDLDISSSNVMAVYGDIVRRDTTGVCFAWMAQSCKDPGFIRVLGSFTTVMSQNTFPVYENRTCDESAEDYFAASIVEGKQSALSQFLQCLYDEYAVVPLFYRDGPFATNDKLANWDSPTWDYPQWEYITHAEPLGTFRLFEAP